jgi:hypothetical protein
LVGDTLYEVDGQIGIYVIFFTEQTDKPLPVDQFVVYQKDHSQNCRNGGAN